MPIATISSETVMDCVIRERGRIKLQWTTKTELWAELGIARSYRYSSHAFSTMDGGFLRS